MSSQKERKLNKMLQAWRRGSVGVQAWLDSQGVYRQLAETYTKSSWLTRIGRGAFIRTGENVEWTGGVYALQAQLDMSVHAGGKTALQLQGFAHFLPLSTREPIYLFGAPAIRLPVWFRNYDWGKKWHFFGKALFVDKELGLTSKDLVGFSIKISSAERAMMELLLLVPQKETFQGAGQLMSGLTTLRPNLVQSLLEQCSSVKVKRLFMYMAEKSGHRWVSRLDLQKVNFGAGKRVIVEGGKLDQKYEITVPRETEDETTPQL